MILIIRPEIILYTTVTITKNTERYLVDSDLLSQGVVCST